jgi:hypothetical protein
MQTVEHMINKNDQMINSAAAKRRAKQGEARDEGVRRRICTGH